MGNLSLAAQTVKENAVDKYVVYIHIVPNGKKYIGITSQRPMQRWANGKGYSKNTLFHRAINKYGWNNIQHIIIAENISKEEACDLEKALIIGCKTTNPKYGYNVSTGGESGTSGVKFGPEFGQKVRDRLATSHPTRGKKFSEETRKKLSNARKGKWSDKQRIALTKVHESMRKQVICLDTGIVYESQTQAALMTGCSQRGIQAACKGEQISSHGMHWAHYAGQTKEEISELLSELNHKKEMVYIIRPVWTKGKRFKLGPDRKRIEIK